MLKSKVRKFLDTTGMRQKAFAEKASVNVTSLNMWLNKNYELATDNYLRIERCLIDEQARLRKYLDENT